MADSQIKQNVEGRLAEIGAERQRLQKRLAVLAELEKEFRGLLIEERPRPPDSEGSRSQANRNGHKGASDLAAVTSNVLANGGKTLAELSADQTIKKWDFGDKAPKRVLHFTLLGMHRAGLAEKAGDRWQLTDQGRKQRLA